MLAPPGKPANFVPRRLRPELAARRASAAAAARGASAIECAEAAITAAFSGTLRGPNNTKLAVEAAINRGADNQQNRLWYSVAADALQRAGVKTAAQAVDRLRRELVRQRQYDHELRRVDTAITRSILEALLIARLARFKRMDALVAPTIATLCRPQDCGAVVHLPAAAARHVMFGG